MYRLTSTLTALACVLLVVATGSQPSSASVQAKALAQAGGVTLTITGERIQWQVGAAHRGGTLTLSGPGSVITEQSFDAGETPTLTPAANGAPLADGSYSYQLILLSGGAAVDPNAAENGRASASGADSSAQGAVISGSFAILDGKFVVPAEEEPPAITAEGDEIAPEDQVIADDLIVQSSLCVGFDCANGTNFGSDTIILRENNLRILFDDTSAGSFPARDWRLIANDSTSGGASHFSIQDATGNTTPFSIKAGAPTNALFVDSSGRIGLKTGTPVLQLHLSDGNTPGIRLDQVGTAGFTPQTWDIGGNEANFFVRDVTSGSRLPFRIRPGAPTSSIDIRASGNVGIGTAGADEDLHVQRSDGTTQVLIKEGNATTLARTLLRIENTGAARLSLSNTASNVWFVGATGSQLFMNKSGLSGTMFNLLADGGLEISPSGVKNFDLDQNGNLAIRGTLSQNVSARAAASESIGDSLGGEDVLSRLNGIPVISWESSAQVSGPAATEEEGAAPEATVSVRHLSPDTAEFHAAFALGLDADSIAPLDVASVALAAAQELDAANRQQAAQIAALQAENAELKARLTAIEAALGVEPAEPTDATSSTFIPSVQN